MIEHWCHCTVEVAEERGSSTGHTLHNLFQGLFHFGVYLKFARKVLMVWCKGTLDARAGRAGRLRGGRGPWRASEGRRASAVVPPTAARRRWRCGAPDAMLCLFSPTTPTHLHVATRGCLRAPLQTTMLRDIWTLCAMHSNLHSNLVILLIQV